MNVMSILVLLAMLLVAKIIFDLFMTYLMKEYCIENGYKTDSIYVYDENWIMVRELPSIFYDVLMKVRILEYETGRKIGCRLVAKIMNTKFRKYKA
jgi:hypothetical protein